MISEFSFCRTIALPFIVKKNLYEVTWQMEHSRFFFSLANGSCRFMHTAAYMLMSPPHYHTTATCRTLQTEAKCPNLSCQTEVECPN